MEGHEEKLKFFARENSIDASELEQALLYLRQQSSSKQNWKGGKLLNQQNSYPDFLETADENGEANSTGENNIVRNLRSELSQIQTHHVEAVNGQAHDIFSRIFQVRMYEFFLPNII